MRRTKVPTAWTCVVAVVLCAAHTSTPDALDAHRQPGRSVSRLSSPASNPNAVHPGLNSQDATQALKTQTPLKRLRFAIKTRSEEWMTPLQSGGWGFHGAVGELLTLHTLCPALGTPSSFSGGGCSDCCSNHRIARGLRLSHPSVHRRTTPERQRCWIQPER